MSLRPSDAAPITSLDLDAERALLAAHEIDARDPAIVRALAIYYMQAEDWKRAQQHARELAALAPPGAPGPAQTLARLEAELSGGAGAARSRRPPGLPHRPTAGTTTTAATAPATGRPTATAAATCDPRRERTWRPTARSWPSIPSCTR